MMVLFALLVAQGALAQHEPTEDSLDALLTPMYGEACGYQSCLPIKPGWLNVHIVPQTHSELGHVYNFDQHFVGEEKPYVPNVMNMKTILDAVVTQLWEDARRKFTLSDTAYLFHWWDKRHPAVHRMMYELIRQGRLTLAGGGLSISDEASTSYHAIIDQFTHSLRKLNSTFRACARPLVAWAVDVYGHSREFTSLMAQMGYDALFINPISYDEEAARMRRKALEFVWRGSDDLGASTDMFTHNLFDGYWAPPGFCFSKLCSDPLLITSSRVFANVQERVDKFIEGVLYRQAPNYETRNIMIIMGHRKAYFDADVWFANIEKLISFTNWRAHQKGLNITMFYSNPACYLSAVHDENPELETKQDDFFPYVHDKDSYTVGMYTSRPTFKFLIREAHVYLQILKQVHVTANLGKVPLVEQFSWIMGVVQDHSVATGVLRLPVKQYYVVKLNDAIHQATHTFMSHAFLKLRESGEMVRYERCHFNISSCHNTMYTKHSIQVYNPLAWPVSMPVRLPIMPVNSQYRVYDSKGAEVPSETIKLPDTILELLERPAAAAADYELVFIATNLPPVGFRSYYIESHPHRPKRSIIKRLKMVKTKKYLLNPMEEGESEESDEIDKITTQAAIKGSLDKGSNKRRSAKKSKQMKVLGMEPNNHKERSGSSDDNLDMPEKAKVPNMPNLSKTLATVVLRDGSKEKNERNIIQVQSIDKDIPERTTETELIMMPMLRDYLHRENILRKLNYADTDSDFKPHEFLKEPTRATDFEPDNDDMKPDARRNEFIHSFEFKPTKEPNLLFALKTEATEPDIMVRHTTMEPDIQVMKKNTTIGITRESDIKVPKRTVEVSTTSDLSGSTTDSDIIQFRKTDIKVTIKDDDETDIRVPIKKVRKHGKTIKPQFKAKDFATMSQIPTRMTTIGHDVTRTTTKLVPNRRSSTESLAIVPVRTEPAVTASANWYTPKLSLPTDSVLVVPVRKATDSSLSEVTRTTASNKLVTTLVTEHSAIEKEMTAEEVDEEDEEDITSTTETEMQTTTEQPGPKVTLPQLKIIEFDDFKARKANSLMNRDTIVDEEVMDKTNDNIQKFRSADEAMDTTNDMQKFRSADEAMDTENYNMQKFRSADEAMDTSNDNMQKFRSADEPMDTTNDNAQKFRSAEDISSTVRAIEATHSTTEDIESSTEVEADTTIPTIKYKVLNASDRMAFKYNLNEATTAPTTPAALRSATDKYFKVNGGGQNFIGNKYVRVNLNRKHRVASVFLSNGIRMALGIQFFHYVSDDPSKFDVRTVPRRDVKAPGAYIFRPIDPYIVKMDDEYSANIIKTSVVEEVRIVYNSWASLMMRLYVDSPVIEVHWLIGPIPVQDNLGRDVFVRYTTDLEHNGAFYTDSNGRQTIKRIRNTRATYEPLDLDPIAGNLYPVTSKIYIEDASKNVRFSVFNDRCQAGGAVVDGAIDMMLHRRILTDDIGFGAYLNETDADGEGIVVAGTHYLYVTKADKNRVFEKKFAKEVAMAPKILVSNPLHYNDNMKSQFYNSKNEYSALKNKLPVGVHLLTFEKLGDDELLVRLENYLEKSDVVNDGVKYVALRNIFIHVKVIWLKETTLAANMFKEQWSPTEWKKKSKFVKSFNEFYGSNNVTYEEGAKTVIDELGGRGIRLAPQQIRTFIVKYEYSGTLSQGTTEAPELPLRFI